MKQDIGISNLFLSAGLLIAWSAPAWAATISTSAQIMTHAQTVANQINSSGSYRFEGNDDCYSFIRRTWNPLLDSISQPGLPMNDYPDQKWVKIPSWAILIPGDVLATAQGHFWGGNWHAGLYAGASGGTYQVFDDTPSWGARQHPVSWEPNAFLWYYVPTHRLLAGK